MSDNQEQEYLEDGYVKISRRVFSSKTFNGLNAIQKYIAIYLILMANWKDNEWWDSYQKKFIKIKRGSFITSIEQIRKDIKDRLVTTKKIRTCLELLKNMQFLAIKTTSHNSHITIIKYDIYQTDNNYKANKRAKQGQSKGKARAITNNVKNDKNVIKEKKDIKESGASFSDKSKTKEKDPLEFSFEDKCWWGLYDWRIKMYQGAFPMLTINYLFNDKWKTKFLDDPAKYKKIIKEEYKGDISKLVWAWLMQAKKFYIKDHPILG